MSLKYFVQCLVIALQCVICYSKHSNSSNEKDKHIIKGYTCSTESYPFIVMVAEQDTSDGEWYQICGGTLIGEKWVVSAAHCFQHNRQYAIVAGINNPDDPPAFIEAHGIYMYPLYDASFLFHDIAVIELDRPIKKSKHIEYINLPTSKIRSDKLPCSNGLIIGWDRTKATDSGTEVTSKLLQCATVPIISWKKCRHLYQHTYSITNDQICTLSSEGIDACKEDSGGPLLCDHIQVGIISWGIGCTVPTNPGVYTRMDSYLDFIKAVIHDQYDENQVNQSSCIFRIDFTKIITMCGILLFLL